MLCFKVLLVNLQNIVCIQWDRIDTSDEQNYLDSLEAKKDRLIFDIT